MRAEAVDGAVITADPDDTSGGWAVNCTVCGYVTSDSGQADSKRFVEDAAAHHEGWHEGWHEAEYEREQARR